MSIQDPISHREHREMKNQEQDLTTDTHRYTQIHTDAKQDPKSTMTCIDSIRVHLWWFQMGLE
jgi:hypothetical protein